MTRFQTVLFDLDGTLIDSTELILASFRHVRRRFFGDELPDSEYQRGFGMPLRVALDAMARSAEESARLFDAYLAYNLEHHDAMVTAFPEIGDVLRELCARQVTLGLVTGKLHEHARRGLDRTGLSEFFRVLIGGDDVARGKPHPDPVLEAMRLCGGRPEHTLFVGDSPHDIAAGSAAGIATAAVTWGPFSEEVLRAAQPTFVLHRPRELLDILCADC